MKKSQVIEKAMDESKILRLDPKVDKLVLVLQDLETKEKETVAVISADVYYEVGGFDTPTIASAQMLLGEHKMFGKYLQTMIAEIIKMNEENIEKGKIKRNLKKVNKDNKDK